MFIPLLFTTNHVVVLVVGVDNVLLVPSISKTMHEKNMAKHGVGLDDKKSTYLICTNHFNINKKHKS